MKTIQSSKVFSLHQSLSHSKLSNQIEYCQKTISVIRCSLAVLYDNLRHCLKVPLMIVLVVVVMGGGGVLISI